MVSLSLKVRPTGRRSALRSASLSIRTAGRPQKWLSALCVVWAALMYAGMSRAAFDFRDSSWEGTSELLSLARERLGTTRVRVVAKLDYSAITPKDGVLLLHPEVELDYAEISAFLAAGGRLGLLDDHGLGDRLLGRYRIHRVQAPLRPVSTLRGKPHLAIATPAVQAVAGQEQNRHPVVAEVERLVTNHPTALTNPNLTPVLTIAAIGEPDATLAVTGVIAGRGRLFAMGDPSAVINLMLRYPGNRTFAAGLVDYLVENDTWGERSGTLYLLANRFDQAGSFGRTEGLVGDIHQAGDNIREVLSEWHKDGIPHPLALSLAGACILAALVWAARFALAAYRRIAPRYATEAPLIAQGGLPGRAAVLSAPTTDRALVVAELDGLLQEELTARTGSSGSGSPEVVLRTLREQGQPESVVDNARELLLRGRSAQEAILRRRPSRLTAGQVAEYAKKLSSLLAALGSSRKV